MISQLPVQNNANSSISSNQRSHPLLGDPAFTLLHNAFLLGWSITELKSRVQIVACSKNQLLNFVTQTPEQPDKTQDTSQKYGIDDLIKDIILADLNTITAQDITDLVKQANTLQPKSLPTDLSDRDWLSSILRAIFNRIVALHINRFPTSSTRNTVYDLPNSRDSNNPFNYLYSPKGMKDYSCIGIPLVAPAADSQSDNTSPSNASQPAPNPNSQAAETDQQAGAGALSPSQSDNTSPSNASQPAPNPNSQAAETDQQAGAGALSPSFVQDFKLYDTARRAINCLTLLLTNADDSLDPEIIGKLQEALLANAFDKSDSIPTSKIDKTTATIKKLSGDIASILDAWDSYLRETYFFASAATQDTGFQATSGAKTAPIELELTSYEAGRSLANLSWGASIILAPLEALFQNGLQDASKMQALNEKAQDAWLNVFNDRDVNHVQHQITALSTAFDEAFYRVNPHIKPSDPNDMTTPPNPELPSQAIQAVVQSLNYWQRAIVRICTPEGGIKSLPGPQPGNPWKNSQAEKPGAPPAAEEEPRTPPAAEEEPRTRTAHEMAQQHQTTQQKNKPSTTLTWNMSNNLRNELVQQSSIWQSLLLCQQGLQSYSIDKVTQRILDEFMKNLELTIKKEVRHTTIMWVLFGAIVVVIVGFLLYLAVSNPKIISDLIPVASITTLIALIAPLLNASRGRFGQFWSYLGSRFGAVGTTLEQSLARGYEQVLIEFNYLNHNVGITFPLVEFFLWQEIAFGDNAVKDGYDFLVNVFWTSEDREEELQRVTQAAFGPVGAFIGTQVHTKSTIGRLWSSITRSSTKSK